MYTVTVTMFGQVTWQRTFKDADVARMVAAKLASDDPLRTVTLTAH